MTRMTGPDYAVMCSLINIHKYTYIISSSSGYYMLSLRPNRSRCRTHIIQYMQKHTQHRVQNGGDFGAGVKCRGERTLFQILWSSWCRQKCYLEINNKEAERKEQKN